MTFPYLHVSFFNNNSNNNTNSSRIHNYNPRLKNSLKRTAPSLKISLSKRGGKKKEKKEKKNCETRPRNVFIGILPQPMPPPWRMENERIIRGNDPSFRLAATKKRGEFSSARRGRDARKNGGGRGLRDAVGWTRTRESFSSQPREDEERRKKRRRRRRDPPAKGSYYNKFVGDLRSGNNSELRVTLRMCLSLLLFKWEWKATSCAGCDLHLSLFPPLLLYFLPSPARQPWKNRFEKQAFLERWND